MAKKGTKTRKSPTRKSPTRKQPTRMTKITKTMEKSRIAKTKKTKRKAKEDKHAAKVWREHMERGKYEMFPSIVTHEVRKAANQAAEAVAADYGYLKRRATRPFTRTHQKSHTRARRNFKHARGGKRTTRKH